MKEIKSNDPCSYCVDDKNGGCINHCSTYWDGKGFDCFKGKLLYEGEEKNDVDYLYQKQFLDKIKRQIVLEKQKTLLYPYATALEILKQYEKHFEKRSEELNMFERYCKRKIKESENEKS